MVFIYLIWVFDVFPFIFNQMTVFCSSLCLESACFFVDPLIIDIPSFNVYLICKLNVTIQ